MGVSRIRGATVVLALALLLLMSSLPQALSAEMMAHIIGETGGYRLVAELGRASASAIQSDLFLPFILSSFGEPVVPTPTPTPQPPVVEAWVSNETPPRYSTVTVYGHIHRHGVGIPDVPMNAVWHYRTTSTDCDGQSNADGVASCARNIAGASAGHYVRVVVTFTYAGQTYMAETGFTPQ
jgi:hypothetical protein